MIEKMPPTKSNLFKLVRELKFSTEGYELLDRKREVLIMEVVQVMHNVKKLQMQLHGTLKKAYELFEQAYITMGSTGIERANYAFLQPLELSIKERSVMGVLVPNISLVNQLQKAKLGMLDTTEELDLAIHEFQKVVPLLVEYTQANLTLTRLAKEIQKTQRRVNALENIFIPNASDTIKFIQNSLEENERDDLFRRKKVKK